MFKSLVFSIMILLNNQICTQKVQVESLPVVSCEKSIHNEYKITVKKGENFYEYYSFNKPSAKVKVVVDGNKIVDEF